MHSRAVSTYKIKYMEDESKRNMFKAMVIRIIWQCSAALSIKLIAKHQRIILHDHTYIIF